jgi:hypothetical protein
MSVHNLHNITIVFAQVVEIIKQLEPLTLLSLQAGTGPDTRPLAKYGSTKLARKLSHIAYGTVAEQKILDDTWMNIVLSAIMDTADASHDETARRGMLNVAAAAIIAAGDLGRPESLRANMRAIIDGHQHGPEGDTND